MSGRRLFILGSMAVVLILLAVVVKSGLDRLSVPPWGNPQGEDLSPAIAGETQVGQQFTAPLPGLYRIEVGLACTGTPPCVPIATTAHQVTFHLKADPAALEDLATASFHTSDLQLDVPFAFEIEPIRGSKGQGYYFYLESADSVPGDAIAARYSPDAILQGASAHVNGQAAEGNLQFQTFYTLRTRDRVDLLLSRMAEGRPYMLGTKGFYVGLGGVYALTLTLFLWRVAHAVLQEEGS